MTTIDCLGHEFDMTLTADLTADRVDRLCSPYLRDMSFADKRDNFEIEHIHAGENRVEAAIKMRQQAAHPNSEGGFHLTAVAVLDFIDMIAQQVLARGSRVQLRAHTVSCKRGIRSRDLAPSLKFEAVPGGTPATRVSFDLDDRAFFGEMIYEAPLPAAWPASVPAPAPGRAFNDRFSIESFQVRGAQAHLDMDFSCDFTAMDGPALGPGMALAMATQGTIVHGCALCGLNRKESGVVVSVCNFRVNEDIPGPGRTQMTSTVKDIRSAHRRRDYVVMDVECAFNGGQVVGDLTFYFEPF